MKVAIVQYNAGNSRSVAFALQRLGVKAEISADPELLRRADRLIFPGVGEAGSAMAFLRRHGLDELLRTFQRPVLGICLGLQLMCAWSEENQTPGLNLFPVRVHRFPPTGKVPHVGWNTIHQPQGALFKRVPDGSYLYFVHSYFAEPNPWAIASAHYLVPFCAALARDNYLAVQFHPEKSGPVGTQILKNFLELP
ncbi:MAG: imidazole glycerol phosphate synthase subunit HisH [Calditrichaeota bacterium]|nr:MAG: imidazole glycerol phosphate synthase subunit HisH [Calditrichota bacterium]